MFLKYQLISILLECDCGVKLRVQPKKGTFLNSLFILYLISQLKGAGRIIMKVNTQLYTCKSRSPPPMLTRLTCCGLSAVCQRLSTCEQKCAVCLSITRTGVTGVARFMISCTLNHKVKLSPCTYKLTKLPQRVNFVQGFLTSNPADT